MECVGVVVRTGPRVTRVKVGDRVGAITAGCFATYVTCSEATLTPLLPGVSPEQSAVYATFTTIVRALEDLIRLERGETLLVHSAAGALGIAAIQYAKWRGARVFATASTPEKREFLRELGVEEVGDSRSLAFVDQVRAWTDGRGVDAVLNFLAGEARLQSLALLATGGRFVDVGKPGGVRDAQLPARLFNTNMLFANVDLDQLLRDSPETMQRLAKRVVELFAEGVFQPLPTRVFEPDQIDAAFRLMARAEHIGKIVIGFADQKITLTAQRGAALRGDRSYLVTGAFGGFGFTVCRWLVSRGARHLVMVGRRGAEAPGAAERIRELTAQGASVTAVAADVGEADGVRALVRRFGDDLPPLAGVIHAAMVLDDGVFTAMTPERLARVMHAKIRGAVHLAEATEGLDLDFLLLFSSIAGLTGGVGQANYAAANAFLDGYASYLRGRGRPVTSIGWGVLADSGVVARSPELMRLLTGQGLVGMSDYEALAGLDSILSGSAPEVVCMKLDWAALATRARAELGLMGDLLKSTSATEAPVAKGLAALAAEIAAGPSKNPVELAEASIAAVVAGVLRTSPDRLELRRPLNAAGIDSLMATELSVALLREYGLRVTVLDLLRTLSVADIAAQVLSLIHI